MSEMEVSPNLQSTLDDLARMRREAAEEAQREINAILNSCRHIQAVAGKAVSEISHLADTAQAKAIALSTNLTPLVAGKIPFYWVEDQEGTRMCADVPTKALAEICKVNLMEEWDNSITFKIKKGWKDA